MAITQVSYTRKAPDITIIEVTNLVEFRDWAQANLPSNYVVNDVIINYGTLFLSDGISNWSIGVGTCMGTDSNGKMFKLTKELLDAFYDIV
jgi:hypothetical protein